MKKMLLLGLLAIATGCGQKISFDEGPVSKEGSVSCQPGQTTVTRPTKILFLVDQSGSNVSGNPTGAHPDLPTDPQKTFRFGVIDEFYLKYAAKSNLGWGFISFDDAGAIPRITVSGVPAFSNSAAMNSALTAFLGSTDVGATPYRAALRMAADMISRDVAAGGSYLYRIALMTDGWPTDYCSDPLSSYCQGEVYEPLIMSDMQALMNLAPGKVELSTVYYGPPDAAATGRLQRMATAGGGQFVDSNVSRDIHLDDVITVPVTCQ